MDSWRGVFVGSPPRRPLKGKGQAHNTMEYFNGNKPSIAEGKLKSHWQGWDGLPDFESRRKALLEGPEDISSPSAPSSRSLPTKARSLA